jgi:hypothetical protein
VESEEEEDKNEGETISNKSIELSLPSSFRNRRASNASQMIEENQAKPIKEV